MILRGGFVPDKLPPLLIERTSKLFMKLTRWMGLAALAASVQLLPAADITGKITLKGTPPPEKELPLDPGCGALHAGDKPKTRLYVVGKDNGLGDVFVFIKDGLTGKTFPVPAEPKLLDQKGCEYNPYVSGVQANQKLLVRNSDPLMHNVHLTQTNPDGNKEKNLAQFPKAADLDFTLPKATVGTSEPLARFKCEVHGWMFAYVGVTDSPFYSVSDKDGTFTIHNVPAGNYTVEAFHRKAGKKDEKVTVGDANATVNFTLEVPAAQ
jgi:hypothetical protein